MAKGEVLSERAHAGYAVAEIGRLSETAAYTDDGRACDVELRLLIPADRGRDWGPVLLEARRIDDWQEEGPGAE